MDGCDCLDQLISYYNNFDRKTIKEWKRIFMGIIEVWHVNAYIIHTLTRLVDGRKFTLKQFKEKLIEELYEKSCEIDANSVKNDAVHSKPKMHLVVYVNADRNCVICSRPKKRKRTNFICSGCESKPY